MKKITNKVLYRKAIEIGEDTVDLNDYCCIVCQCLLDAGARRIDSIEWHRISYTNKEGVDQVFNLPSHFYKVILTMAGCHLENIQVRTGNEVAVRLCKAWKKSHESLMAD